MHGQGYQSNNQAGYPQQQYPRQQQYSYGTQPPDNVTYQRQGYVPGVGYSPFHTIQEKSVAEAYILGIAFGLIGAHHFYLRRPLWGLLYFFSFGLAGCGYVIDLFRMPYLVSETNRIMRDPKLDGRKNVSDAYTLWFPFGLLGFHHFYLRNPFLGLVYMFTLGLFGIGWLIDLCLIPRYVKVANDERQLVGKKSLGVAYVLAISPFGVMGAAHFYLNRPVFGLLYFFTFGLCGVGYLVDWFRIPFLYRRYNEAEEGDEVIKHLKHTDDAYILWFPMGLIGLHHFYLKRYVWGLIYFFTLGVLGIGWLVDACRIPFLIKDYNQRMYAIASLPGFIRQENVSRHYSQATIGGSTVTITGSGHPVDPPPYLPGNQNSAPQQQYTGGYQNATFESALETRDSSPPPYSTDTADIKKTSI